jgi:hypothetical protein
MTAERRTRLTIVFSLLLFIPQISQASGSVSLRSSLADDITYFVGVWKIAIKSEPSVAYKWTVTTDKDGAWLEGTVEKDGVKTSTDFWRQNGKIIERYTFTGDGLFVRVASAGWKAGTISFNGIASGKTGDFRVRETITREGEAKFHAVWEKQGEDGKWVVFSDESCTK